MPSIDRVDDDVPPTGFGVRGTSTIANGVHGKSDTGDGVLGDSPKGIALHGKSESGTGVQATSDSSIGVYGYSKTGNGVYAVSETKDGVRGYSYGVSEGGVHGISPGGYGVYGESDSKYGVFGSGPTGVRGESSGGGDGVHGKSSSGKGVYGESDSNYGVLGQSKSNYGVNGEGIIGVFGRSGTFAGVGVVGESGRGNGVIGASDYFDGVVGSSSYCDGVVGYSPVGRGVVGSSRIGSGMYGESDTGNGVLGSSGSGSGVYAESYSGTGVYGYSTIGFAAYLDGRVYIRGPLSKPGGQFKIDHPLDPANKYLSHSFVESPDMKNIYDGVVALDDKGGAEIELPDWFGALNKDFRYQLTAIGAPGPNLYIAEEICDGVTNDSNHSSNNRFKIAGGTPRMKVSWHVTGIRKDPWANAHRIQVEEDKPDKEQGYYIYPELYGQPAENGISRLFFPEEEQELLINESKRTKRKMPF